MENRPNRLINAALIATLGVGSAACNTAKPIHVEPSPTIAPPRETMTPFQPPTLTPEAAAKSTETLTPIPTERTVEDLFKLGSFNTATTPFTLETTTDLMKLMGKLDWFITRSTHADIPLPITTPTLGTEDQLQIFEKSARDNASGNAYFVIGTDQPNHVLLNMHSLWISAPGDLARQIGGWAYNNPDKLDKLYGQKLILTPKGSAPITAEIAFVETMPDDEFNKGKNGVTPWGFLPGNENPTIAILTDLGIPDSIVKDKTQGVYYLTIEGCQNIVPGNIDVVSPSMSWNEAYTLNTTNVSLLTLKFTLP